MIDDILVFGTHQAEHDNRLKEVLHRLEVAGVKLNKAKCVFSVDKVKFLGVMVSASGISPDPDKFNALLAMEPPSDVSGVRRLLGMANHVGRFLPQLSTITAPIRELLQKNKFWTWNYAQQDALDKLKKMLSSEICMAKYDPSLPTTVSADASSFGLGAVLLQDQPQGERRAVAYASRSLNPTEKRYSQTEKEALAVSWAVERFDQFVRGIQFDVETDHRPLSTLLGSAELDMIPPRIQRIRMRLMRYRYRVLYVPGKLLATADTLSRAPVDAPENARVDAVELFVGAVLNSVEDLSTPLLQDIRRLQSEDGTSAALIRYCEEGWPKANSRLPIKLREY